MSLRLLLPAALLALAACGKPAPVPRPASAPRAAAAGAPVSAQPAVPPAAPAQRPAAPEWTYSSVGKRDPFRSYISEAAQAGSLATRCATPLGRFEIEQLRLVAVITGLEDPVGMVEAPNGMGYNVRRGACIGKNGGVVAAVRSREVVVSEWAIRADGTRDSTQTVISLPKDEALNLEEFAP